MFLIEVPTSWSDNQCSNIIIEPINLAIRLPCKFDALPPRVRSTAEPRPGASGRLLATGGHDGLLRQTLAEMVRGAARAE